MAATRMGTKHRLAKKRLVALHVDFKLVRVTFSQNDVQITEARVYISAYVVNI